MIPSAVFDTMVLLQAAANPGGPAGACLRMVTEGRIVLLLSAEGLAELEDVLGRGRIRRKFPLLTAERVEVFLRGLRARARLVADVPAVLRYLRDPGDEHLLDLVIATGAQYLVTRDNDLLD